MIENIIIAKHHGFCMGVKRAINTAEKTAREETGPVTILNEIVHNEAVVDQFKNQGVGQSFSVDDVEKGTLIISAHGIAPGVIEKANQKGLKVVDATCPLVTRIYDIIKKAVKEGFHIVHYGNPSHDETIGIVGHAPETITVASNTDELLALPDWKDKKLGLTVQTTAHIDEFSQVMELAKKKWPHLEIFDTICNATTQRQTAIYELAPQVDMILVVGSASSANSQRLAKISNRICGNGKLISSADEIDPGWFEDQSIKDVGISAGASTPDFLVVDVIKKLKEISNNLAGIIYLNKRKSKTF